MLPNPAPGSLVPAPSQRGFTTLRLSALFWWPQWHGLWGAGTPAGPWGGNERRYQELLVLLRALEPARRTYVNLVIQCVLGVSMTPRK